jgi:peptide/nickel transport system permease protein
MRTYIIHRLLLIPLIMLLVSFMTHTTFRIIPGSVAEAKCQLQCTPEVIDAIEHEYGLDRGFFAQYGSWLGVYPDENGDVSGILQGDFGESFLTTISVDDELKDRLPVTLELMTLALILSLVLGVPPGVISAIRPGTPLDWFVRLVSVFWISVPSFYLGIVIITFGANWFGWSPPNFATGQAAGLFEDPITNLETYFFPSLVLAMGIAAVIMRLTRSSLLEVMRNDYIRTAWSKGLRERSIVWRHALKNAMIPVLTIIGLQVGGLIGGSVIVESVFGLNGGMGFFLLQSIIARDLLVVQSLVLLFAFSYVFINLVVDVGYAWLDPRIRYG